MNASRLRSLLTLFVSLSPARRRAVLAAVMTIVTALWVGDTALPANNTPDSGNSDMAAPTYYMGLLVEPEYPDPYDDYQLFGGWTDTDADGCDTRLVILAEKSASPSDTCHDPQGPWVSWYDGKLMPTVSETAIDHTVPLKEAFQSGAWMWSRERREAFANDAELNGALDVVSTQVASQKGSSDPAEWLPPTNKCRYVAAWIAVKRKWGLSVDTAEASALARIMNLCPTQPSGHASN